MIDIAMTERGDFRRCHRAWGVQSANGLSLVPRGIPALHFYVGNAFHAAMEAQALGLPPIESMQAWFARKRRQYAQDHAEHYGVPMTPQALSKLNEPEQLVTAMVTQYYNRYGWDNPLESQGLRYIAPEISFRIPIEGVLDQDGEQVYLVGTLDGLAEEVDNPDNIWLVEHKTYSVKASPADLQFDDQLTGYNYAAWVLLGKPLAGTLYDGANKVKPKVPVVLRGEGPTKGKLSRAIEGPMTYQSYLDAILRLGHDPTDAYYVPILLKLKLREDMDDNAFHVRHRLSFGEEQMLEWEKHLAREAREMAIAAAEPLEEQYPNRVWSGCWDCDVKNICDAMTSGEDYEAVIDEHYTEGTYGTRAAQKDMEPEEVSSIRDLKAVVERRRQRILADQVAVEASA